MSLPSQVAALLPVLLGVPSLPLWSQTGATLSEEEQDKIREAQDPSERIDVYLELAQVRLERFESFRKKPVDPQYDYAAYLDDLLVEYIALNDELKNWIEYQYQHNGDMRRGLRKLLERGPPQLEELRRAQQPPDAHAARYGDTLRDSIDQLSDTLDGATRALADQEKKFGELKREEKAAAQLAKERAKEEKKRTKEERKLRKRQHKGGVPADSDENGSSR